MLPKAHTGADYSKAERSPSRSLWSNLGFRLRCGSMPTIRVSPSRPVTYSSRSYSSVSAVKPARSASSPKMIIWSARSVWPSLTHSLSRSMLALMATASTGITTTSWAAPRSMTACSSYLAYRLSLPRRHNSPSSTPCLVSSRRLPTNNLALMPPMPV